jgi:transketolase
MPIQVQEASRTPNRLEKYRTSPWHIITKTISTENTERILKAVREKKQTTYKGKPIKIITDFSTNLKNKKGMEWGILATDWK